MHARRLWDVTMKLLVRSTGTAPRGSLSSEVVAGGAAPAGQPARPSRR